MNNRINKILRMSLFLLVILCVMNSSIEVSSAKTVSKINYIKMVIDEIIDKSSSYSGIYGGKVIEISPYKSGRVDICGKKISKKTVYQYKNQYGLSTKNAQYLAEAFELNLLSEKQAGNLKSPITIAEAAIIIAKANELLYGENYNPKAAAIINEADISLVVNERITDIKNIKGKNNRQWFAKAYLFGFIEGEPDGAYSHTRTFSSDNNAPLKVIKTLVSRLTNIEERVSLSEDWQVCRDSKLPRNYEFYGYIIDSFPNSYYETGFNGITSSKSLEQASLPLEERLKSSLGLLFIRPIDLSQFNRLTYPWSDDAFVRFGREYEESNRNNIIPTELVKSSVEFYTYALNVDYRTIENDDNWKRIMLKYLSEKEVETYINNCKANQTIIECDLVAADISGCYWYDSKYNCKVYAHMRIISDKQLSKGNVGSGVDEECGELFVVKKGRELGERYTRLLFGEQYLDYKLGTWIDFYFNTNSQTDMYGCLNTSNTQWDIMIDYSGAFPWLLKYPYA